MHTGLSLVYEMLQWPVSAPLIKSKLGWGGFGRVKAFPCTASPPWAQSLLFSRLAPSFSFHVHAASSRKASLASPSQALASHMAGVSLRPGLQAPRGQTHVHLVLP